MLYGTAQATGQTRYAFNPEDYISTDINRAPQDRFSYGDDYFRIAATGPNNVAFKMKESLNGEYYITGDERWFLIKGSNLSTEDGATYLWWINGHNNGQVPPSYICSYGGSQYYIWNMECINSINSRVFRWFLDNTEEKIILNGRDADWKFVTAAGLTALDENGGTISDIGFYSDKEINDKYNGLAKYLLGNQCPDGEDVTATYITNPSFEANGRTLNREAPTGFGWTVKSEPAETAWWGVNEPSPGAGGDPQPTHGRYIFGVWDGGVMSASISQTISGLPKGRYLLSVDMQASNMPPSQDNDGVRLGKQHIFAGEKKGYFADQHSTAGVGDAYPMQTISVVFEQAVDNTDINIGVATSDAPNQTWFKIDNFRLYRLTAETTPLSVAVMEVRQDVQYGTFCAPFEVAIPDGVTASTCTGTTGGVLEMETLSNNIPANTPVILYAENGYPRTHLIGLRNSQEDLVTTTGNLLVGNVGTGAKDVPAGNNYLLQKQDDKVGFYKVSTSGRTIGYNRCYLSIPSNSNNARPSFFFDEDDFTGVTTLKQTEQDSPKDGKYLIGNKIILVKNGVKYSANGQKLN